MNTDLRKKAKNNFGTYFFTFMNNVDFRKTLENMRKYRDIKIVTRERRRNNVVSQPSFPQIVLATEMKKL